MLNMTYAEVELRRGSRLLWTKYSYSPEWMLTSRSIPVRLLAAVGSNHLKDKRGFVMRFRVMTFIDTRLYDVDRLYLKDPTRDGGGLLLSKSLLIDYRRWTMVESQTALPRPDDFGEAMTAHLKSDSR